MSIIQQEAPSGDEATLYDLRMLGSYAALLDAERMGIDWREAASIELGLDPNAEGAHACWASHLARAHWSVGEGLEEMLRIAQETATARR
jgi:hypothetical protein